MISMYSCLHKYKYTAMREHVCVCVYTHYLSNDLLKYVHCIVLGAMGCVVV